MATSEPITLEVYHLHSMKDKPHRLSVDISPNRSILDLKKALLKCYPSKKDHMIAPPEFQKIICHGNIFDDDSFIYEMDVNYEKEKENEGGWEGGSKGGLIGPKITSLKVSKSTEERLNYVKRRGQIVLKQFPSCDRHLNEIFKVASFPGKVLRPEEIGLKLTLSSERVVRILRFLEGSGLIKIQSYSPPATIEHENENNLPSVTYIRSFSFFKK